MPYSNVYNKPAGHYLRPVLLNAVIVFSALAFIATSMPPGTRTRFTDINKIYNFNFSKRELIARLNSVQLEYVREVNSYGNGRVDFDSSTNIFYYRTNIPNDSQRKDTVAVLLDYEKVKATDTLRLRTSFAAIAISGDDTTSELKLISINGFIPRNGKRDYKAKAIKVFEWAVIKGIKKR